MSKDDHSHPEISNPNFDKWFQASKVVHDNGLPRVMYHGTGADIEAFDPKKICTNFDSSILGFYFTNAPCSDLSAGFGFGSTASEYAKNAGGTPNVMPVYLSLQNPLVLDDAAEWGGAASMLDIRKTDIARWVKSGQHDGVIAYDATGEDPEIACVALRPEQVKSAIGNSGAYDPTNPDITDRRALAAQQALDWLASTTKKAAPHVKNP